MAKDTLPVLNPNYPADIIGMQGSGYFYFEAILDKGNPEECTYQWYWGDGTKIVGATLPSLGVNRYSALGNHYVYCEVTNAMGTVRSRTATLTVREAYLYKNGDFNNDITGGWDFVPASTNAATLGTFTNDGMLHIDLLATGQTMQGYCTTRNPIDLTNHNKIRFTVATSYTDNYYSPWKLCVSSLKSGAYSDSVESYNAYIPARNEDTIQTFELDITNVTGEYYVGFGNYVTNVNTRIGVSMVQLL